MIEDMEDRRDLFKGKKIVSVKDVEDARKLNLKDNYWACYCGSRSFHLKQTEINVKAICSKCGNSEILYWNRPSKDNSMGAMKDLETGKWWHPKAKIVVE